MKAAFLSKENEGKITKKRSKKERAGKIVKYETFQQKGLGLSFEDKEGALLNTWNFIDRDFNW